MYRAKIGPPTISQTFKQQLNELLKVIGLTNTHFVRCIKPNEEKAPTKFDAKDVLRQLRYSGMLEYINIRQSGYGARRAFNEFIDRYSDISSLKAKDGEPNMTVKNILVAAKIPSHHYQIGHSQLFICEQHINYLEMYKDALQKKITLPAINSVATCP